MKKARKLNSAVIAGALCLGTVGWFTAQAQVSSTPSSHERTTTSGEQTRTYDQTREASQNGDQTMEKIDRVSKLIGTSVKNPQGETLGKIEDVVVDFDTGKVSYCAMEVGHEVFSKGKYLAIPLSAFRPSPDGRHLILNADKDKVAQAQGFDRNNFPPANNPSWGAQPFWENPSSRTPAPITTPNGSTTEPRSPSSATTPENPRR